MKTPNLCVQCRISIAPQRESDFCSSECYRKYMVSPAIVEIIIDRDLKEMDKVLKKMKNTKDIKVATYFREKYKESVMKYIGENEGWNLNNNQKESNESSCSNDNNIDNSTGHTNNN